MQNALQWQVMIWTDLTNHAETKHPEIFFKKKKKGYTVWFCWNDVQNQEKLLHSEANTVVTPGEW